MPPRRDGVNPLVQVGRRCRGALCSGSAASQLWALGIFQETLRWNVFPTVWPSGSLTSRPAIRVNSETLPEPPTMVLSVTVIKSENERAQPINRPCGPRNCTGRAPFSEKSSGSSSSMEPAVVALSLGHYPAQLFGGAPPGFPAPQVNEQLPGKGDDGPFAGAGVSLGIQQNSFPLLDQIVVGLVEERPPGQFHQIGAQASVTRLGDAQVGRAWPG